VFRIQPEELFQIIEDIGNADASYEPRRQSGTKSRPEISFVANELVDVI